MASQTNQTHQSTRRMSKEVDSPSLKPHPQPQSHPASNSNHLNLTPHHSNNNDSLEIPAIDDSIAGLSPSHINIDSIFNTGISQASTATVTTQDPLIRPTNLPRSISSTVDDRKTVDTNSQTPSINGASDHSYALANTTAVDSHLDSPPRASNLRNFHDKNKLSLNHPIPALPLSNATTSTAQQLPSTPVTGSRNSQLMPSASPGIIDLLSPAPPSAYSVESSSTLMRDTSTGFPVGESSTPLIVATPGGTSQTRSDSPSVSLTLADGGPSFPDSESTFRLTPISKTRKVPSRIAYQPATAAPSSVSMTPPHSTTTPPDIGNLLSPSASALISPSPSSSPPYQPQASPMPPIPPTPISIAAYPISPSLQISPLADVSLLQLSLPLESPTHAERIRHGSPSLQSTPSHSGLQTYHPISLQPSPSRSLHMSIGGGGRSLATRLEFDSDDEDTITTTTTITTRQDTKTPTDSSQLAPPPDSDHLRTTSSISIRSSSSTSVGGNEEEVGDHNQEVSLNDIQFNLSPSAQVSPISRSSATTTMNAPEPTSPLSPLSPLPGSIHPYARYLTQQEPLLHILPPPPVRTAPTVVAIPPSTTSSPSPAPPAADIHDTLCALRMDASLSQGFLFLFLDRLIDEGENFLLYSYPSSSSTARRILGMRGVLSVLEGAVAGVTGQKAQIGVLEELSYQLENSQDTTPRPPSASPSLKVKVCSRELSDIGRGLAFVCLTWSPMISDEQLSILTRNLLTQLRLSIGPIHLGLFKPWLFTEPTRSGKKKAFVLKEFWKASNSPEVKPTSAPSASSDETDEEAHPPVRASALLTSTLSPVLATPRESPLLADPQYARLPSDLTLLMEKNQQVISSALPDGDKLVLDDSQVKDQSSDNGTTLSSSPTKTALTIEVGSGSPAISILPSNNISSTSPSSAPPTPSQTAALALNQTLLCCSYESMLLLDAFFRQAARTICRDLLLTAPTICRLPNPHPSAALLPPSPHAAHRHSLQGSLGGLRRHGSFNAMTGLDLLAGGGDLDALAVKVMTSSFLSTTLVPQLEIYNSHSDRKTNTPNVTNSNPKVIAHELSRLVNGKTSTASTATPAAVPILGAILFHRGELVHVAYPHHHHASHHHPTASHPSPSHPSPSQTLRHCDVHEISNLLTLMGLFQPQTPAPTTSPPTSSPNIHHASIHRVWFGYGPHELTEVEAMKFHLSTASTVAPSASANGRGRAATSIPVTATGHTRGVTSLAVPRTTPVVPSTPTGLSTRTNLATPKTTMVKSTSGSNLHKMNQAPPSTPTPSTNTTSKPSTTHPSTQPEFSPLFRPFQDSKIYQTRMVSILQFGDEGEFVLALVMHAPTHRQAQVIQADAIRAVEEKKLKEQSVAKSASYVSHEFFFACAPYHPQAMYETTKTLYHHHSTPSSSLNPQSTSKTLSSSPPASTSDGLNARAVLTHLIEGVLSSPPPSSIVGGTAVPIRMRSQSTSSLRIPMTHRSMNSTTSNLLMTNQSPAATSRLTDATLPTDVIYDYSLLDYGRGIIVRRSTGDSAALPVHLHLDFQAKCAKIHKIFQQFQHLFINASTMIQTGGGEGGGANGMNSTNSTNGAETHLPSSSSSLAPSLPSTPHHVRSTSSSHRAINPATGLSTTYDHHASLESLGSGNHLFFRRHKTLETIRQIHECGFRLTYPQGPAYWVKGAELFICCDDSLAPDLLEATFQYLQ